MKGIHRFCPETGAELSDEKHYDNDGPPLRAPKDVDGRHWGDEPEGLLSNGELVSSRYALANYFRRCHQRHHDEDGALYRAMALALRRLKRETDAWDVWVWFALAERLNRKGHDVEWMRNHVDVPCPWCSGPLKWEQTARGIQGKCATNCRNQWNQDYVEPVVREKVRAAYNSTFANTDDSKCTISSVRFLES